MRPQYLQFTTEAGDTFLVEIATPISEGHSQNEADGEVQAAIGDKIMEKSGKLVTVSQDTFEDALNIVKSNVGLAFDPSHQAIWVISYFYISGIIN